MSSKNKLKEELKVTDINEKHKFYKAAYHGTVEGLPAAERGWKYVVDLVNRKLEEGEKEAEESRKLILGLGQACGNISNIRMEGNHDRIHKDLRYLHDQAIEYLSKLTKE
jgi:hypothetical protein